MEEAPEFSIVISAYNEEEGLQKVLPELVSFADGKNWEVIEVEDGSTDDTRSVAERCGVRVIGHPYNLRDVGLL